MTSRAGPAGLDPDCDSGKYYQLEESKKRGVVKICAAIGASGLMNSFFLSRFNMSGTPARSVRPIPWCAFSSHKYTQYFSW